MVFAAITHPSGIIVPLYILTPQPIQTLLPIIISLLLPVVHLGKSKKIK